MAKRTSFKFKEHIRKESKVEVYRLIREYGITDTGGQLLLETFSDADTTERNGQDIINKEGMTFTDRFGQIRAHPLLTVIRDARSQKMAALKALCLDLESLHDGVGRPPGRLKDAD